MQRKEDCRIQSLPGVKSQNTPEGLQMKKEWEVWNEHKAHQAVKDKHHICDITKQITTEWLSQAKFYIQVAEA